MCWCLAISMLIDILLVYVLASVQLGLYKPLCKAYMLFDKSLLFFLIGGSQMSRQCRILLIYSDRFFTYSNTTVTFEVHLSLCCFFMTFCLLSNPLDEMNGIAVLFQSSIRM